ncbi:MAG: class I SAM-dependent methyltransferase, partial [Thermomicrobiales bacterium]
MDRPMGHLRSRLLNFAFQLLYNRFVLFHELAGLVVFGSAWSERRILILKGIGEHATVLDLGAGEGRLVAFARERGLTVTGVDPSPSMREAARKRHVEVLDGSSFAIPYPDRSIDHLVSTYPGSWIVDERTWEEIDRVLRQDGTVRILVGGTYERGTGAALRRWISMLVYGKRPPRSFEIPSAIHQGFTVRTETVRDEWGVAILV